MDETNIKPGKIVRGKWFIAELTVPPGLLHIDSFEVEGAIQNGNDMYFILKAGGLTFTSNEGYSIKVWNDLECDRNKTAKQSLEKIAGFIGKFALEPKISQAIERVVSRQPFRMKEQYLKLFMSRWTLTVGEITEQCRDRSLIEMTRLAFGDPYAKDLKDELDKKNKKNKHEL